MYEAREAQAFVLPRQEWRDVIWDVLSWASQVRVIPAPPMLSALVQTVMSPVCAGRCLETVWVKKLTKRERDAVSGALCSNDTT